MQTKALYVLHIYIDADYKKHDFCLLAPVLYACRFSFAMSLPVGNVLSIDFVKKSGFECCFWSAQCIETQSRTSDNVKTWVLYSLNVRWWSLLDDVVYCNTLRSIKAAFLKLEKAMFTGATFVAMFTITTPGPHTHSKQSKTFHVKCNTKVKCEKKWVW